MSLVQHSRMCIHHFSNLSTVCRKRNSCTRWRRPGNTRARSAHKSAAHKRSPAVGATWQTAPIDYLDNVIIHGEYFARLLCSCRDFSIAHATSHYSRPFPRTMRKVHDKRAPRRDYVSYLRLLSFVSSELTGRNYGSHLDHLSDNVRNHHVRWTSSFSHDKISYHRQLIVDSSRVITLKKNLIFRETRIFFQVIEGAGKKFNRDTGCKKRKTNSFPEC